jgi:hypothetical protein
VFGFCAEMPKTFLQNCRLCRRTIVLKLGWNVLILLLYISGLQHNIKIKNRPLFKHLQIMIMICFDFFHFIYSKLQKQSVRLSLIYSVRLSLIYLGDFLIKLTVNLGSYDLMDFYKISEFILQFLQNKSVGSIYE